MVKFISTTKAAAEADVVPVTVTRWCLRYDIGHKVGGRWRVNPESLRAMLEGRRHDKRS